MRGSCRAALHNQTHEKHNLSSIFCLRTSYAMPGTDIVYGAPARRWQAPPPGLDQNDTRDIIL
eukprot:1110178-Rhodomonas_salina.1